MTYHILIIFGDLVMWMAKEKYNDGGPRDYYVSFKKDDAHKITSMRGARRHFEMARELFPGASSIHITVS